jgi:hypothetical protein
VTNFLGPQRIRHACFSAPYRTWAVDSNCRLQAKTHMVVMTIATRFTALSEVGWLGCNPYSEKKGDKHVELKIYLT